MLCLALAIHELGGTDTMDAVGPYSSIAPDDRLCEVDAPGRRIYLNAAFSDSTFQIKRKYIKINLRPASHMPHISSSKSQERVSSASDLVANSDHSSSERASRSSLSK